MSGGLPDGAVARLIGVLLGQPVVAGHATVPITPRDAHLLADVLAPAVAAIAREAAAAELEAAATEAHAEAYREERMPWIVLRDRAEALRAQS